MGDLFHLSFRAIGRCVTGICIRQRVLFPERVVEARRSCGTGPALLAVTHLSHLEPFFVSGCLERPVRWMTRVEFFPTWWGRILLERCGAFPVDRFGFSLPAVRRAIRLLGDGQVVGIFPEGGVATGADSVLRGGRIKQGVCTVSIWSGVPIVPVVVLGTHALNRVGPWLPARRGRVWMAFGRPVLPPVRDRAGGRRARAELAGRLQAAFMEVYQELLRAEGLSDGDVP